MHTDSTEQFEGIRLISPTTEEEAFRILDEVYPLEKKRIALGKTNEEFARDEHFGLGLWIRNNWIHNPDGESEEMLERHKQCLRMMAGKEIPMIGDIPFIGDPDTVSSSFLERYHDHLRRKHMK